MKVQIHLLLLALTALILVACNGTSGENGDDPFNSDDTSDEAEQLVTITTKLGDCSGLTVTSFTAGESICVEASLTESGQGVAGEIIAFTADLGTLSIDSRVTDSAGLAQVTILSSTSDIGAATVTATSDDTSASSNYELLAESGDTVEAQPTITLSMSVNGQTTNRFTLAQTAVVSAQLLGTDALPLADQIVTFSASLGEFSPTSALTSEEGIAQTQLTAIDGSLGADIVVVQYEQDAEVYSDSLNYQILSEDEISADIVRFGSFDSTGEFVEGQLGVTGQDADADISISAGATLGFSVAIVDENDERILTPTTVSFSTTCVENGLATIDQEVSTINGEAFSTFEDISCAGAGGNSDTAVAILVNGEETLTLQRSFDIQAEQIGSIEFISAEPQTITLSGTGGQGNTSVSTVTFQVNGALGNPLSQQEVNFSLNTEVGGLSLAPSSGFTNSEGQVSTQVTAGSVPTSVRVTATTVAQDGAEIQTQSDLLAVNTGLPDQNSFTLSASSLNPEAFDIAGQEVTLVVRLADTFNNPVPDGTTVSFTTEGGTVEPSCTTASGSCTVTWTSSNPAVDDHRVTVLATAIGHETLFDSNGNNSFDDAENNPIEDTSESGFGVSDYGEVGFVDMSEAWRDDDEDRVKDSSEIFLDFDDDGEFDSADALFNGPQCLSENFCGQGVYASLHVRKALVLVTSSSSVLIDIEQSDGTEVSSNYRSITDPSIVISRGDSLSFEYSYSDTAVQPIADGSIVSVSATAGTLGGSTSLEFGSTNQNSASSATFSLINSLADEEESISSTVTVSITSPSGIESSTSFTAFLE